MPRSAEAIKRAQVAYYERNRELICKRARNKYYNNENYRKTKNSNVKQRIYEESTLLYVRRLFM